MKGVLALLVLLMISGVSVAAEKNYLDTEGLSFLAAGPVLDTCPGQTFPLAFSGPGDAFIFNVVGMTYDDALKASTSDCCLYGPDIWRVAVHPLYRTGKSHAGDGTVDYFTGRVSKGLDTGDVLQLVVTADDIPAGYPAGMTLCVEGDVMVFPQ
jgi:hypothetical protein